MNVEVVGNSQSVEIAGFLEGVGSDGIGDIEGKVANANEVTVVAEVVEGGKVTEEDAVGIHASDVLEVAGLASLDDARGSENDV